MIGAARFWSLRQWAARYWAKVGAASSAVPTYRHVYRVAADVRVWMVDAESRLMIVDAESRVARVPEA